MLPAGYTDAEILHEVLQCPRHAHVTLPDMRVIERPGWKQLVTPSFARGGFNEVAYARLDDADADRVIAETIEQYRQAGITFRWVVGPDSAPADLAARLLAHGFYAGQDQIMLALDREDGQTPGNLAERHGVRPPTITKTINRLQAQGFLEKRASNSDARQAHIFLTDTGRETIRAIEKSVKKTEKQALKGLDKKEQKALFKLLARIEANLSAEEIVLADDDGDDAED